MSIINDETSIKNVIIDNSYFTGNYHNSAINIKYSDITCSNSIFEKFYNGKELNRYTLYIYIYIYYFKLFWINNVINFLTFFLFLLIIINNNNIYYCLWK